MSLQVGDSIKVYRRVGYYRGVRYEFDSYIHPDSPVFFVGGGPPEYKHAYEVAQKSIHEALLWKLWFLQCATILDDFHARYDEFSTCGHLFRHHRSGFECRESSPNNQGDYPPPSCECETFTRRAPLAVVVPD